MQFVDAICEVRKRGGAHDLIVEMYVARKRKRDAMNTLREAIENYAHYDCHSREDFDSCIENDELCSDAWSALEAARKEAKRATSAVYRYGKRYTEKEIET